MERRWLGAHKRKLTIAVRPGTSDEELLSLLSLPPRSAAQSFHFDRAEERLSLVYPIQRPGGQTRDLVERLERSELVTGFSIE
jgi:hypothetical protein